MRGRIELEVVDDQEIEPVLDLEAARHGTHLDDVQRRGVVDEYFYRRKLIEPVLDHGEFSIALDAAGQDVP